MLISLFAAVIAPLCASPNVDAPCRLWIDMPLASDESEREIRVERISSQPSRLPEG